MEDGKRHFGMLLKMVPFKLFCFFVVSNVIFVGLFWCFVGVGGGWGLLVGWVGVFLCCWMGIFGLLVVLNEK